MTWSDWNRNTDDKYESNGVVSVRVLLLSALFNSKANRRSVVVRSFIYLLSIEWEVVADLSLVIPSLEAILGVGGLVLLGRISNSSARNERI